MSRENGNAQSRATFFRPSAVLRLSAVLLRKLPNMNPPYPLKEYQNVQKLLSVNLLTAIATSHYQHCQILAGAENLFSELSRIMEKQFSMVDFEREITKAMKLG